MILAGLLTILAAPIFAPTITLGAIILGVLIGVAGFAFVFYGVRYKAAYEAEKAAAASWKDGRDAFQARAERIEQERDRLHSELASERLKTDLTGLVKQLAEQHTEMIAAMSVSRTEAVTEVRSALNGQEERTLERHQEIMGVLRELHNALVKQNGNPR